LTIEPAQGRIEPGEDGAFIVSTNRGILRRLEPGEYVANIYIINNDPDNDSVLVQCFIPVPWPPLIIPLSEGWNLISSCYIFERIENRDQMQQIFDGHRRLIIVKDGIGRYFAPTYNFNNIPCWNFREGYLVKMTEADDLSIMGERVEPDTPIPLLQGWNMIAYFPEEDLEATVAFHNIEDVLIIAKDVDGHFYNPEREFNNMPPLRSGCGYQVKVSQDIDLIYNVP